MWDVCGLTVPPPGAESAAQPQRRRRRRRSSAAAQADLADELAAADADAAADKPIFDDFTSELLLVGESIQQSLQLRHGAAPWLIHCVVAINLSMADRW